MPRADRRSVLRRLALLPFAGAAAACGFEPIHAPRARASSIAVDPVLGAAGFALRERLVERLGPAEVATHRLAVDLAIREEPAVLTQGNIATRYLVFGEATFRLLPAGTAAPVLEETVTARTAYSTSAGDTASAFAARAAARDAQERLSRTLADRIALRLALAERFGTGTRP